MTLKSFISNLSSKNIYLILLTGQILDMINLLVIGEMIKAGLIYIPPMVHGLVQFAIIFILNAIALVFVRKFVKSTPVFIAFIATIILSILFLMAAQFSINGGMSPEIIKLLKMSGTGFQIFSLSFILIVAVKDIFMEQHDFAYCLAGAASIFCIIGTIFGCTYFFFEIWSPGMVKTNGDMNTFLNFSYCTLSGQDPTIEVSSLIKNISIFESIFANLYTVLIVGKLLSR